MVVNGKLPGSGGLVYEVVIVALPRNIYIYTYAHEGGAPTFAVVSVRLFRVVDFPLEGLPTRAIKGSRGIMMSGLARCLRLRAAGAIDGGEDGGGVVGCRQIDLQALASRWCNSRPYHRRRHVRQLPISPP